MTFTLQVPQPLQPIEELVRPRKISYSQLRVWQRCEKKWEFSYLGEWVPKKIKVWLAGGSFVHDLLRVAYEVIQQGGSYELAAEYAFEYGMEGIDTGSIIDASDVDALDINFFSRHLRIVMRYLKHYAKAKDEGRIILGVEEAILAPFETPTGRRFLLHAIIDLIYLVESNGMIGIEDHKTMGGNRWWTPRALLMDSQLSTYGAATTEVGVLAPSGKIRYEVGELVVDQINTYDYQDFNKVPNDKLFRTGTTYRERIELVNTIINYGQVIDEIENKIERGEPFTRNIGKECAYCPFNEVCLYAMKGVDEQEILELGFRHRDSVEDAEIEKNSSAESNPLL